MRLLVLFWGLLAAAPLLAQQRPTLAARHPWGRELIPVIERFEVDVLLFEDLAQTTVTVTFENPTTRNMEGELSLPLPHGATISGYQLEVNGAMRDSTAVEREQARFAYESIKRQNIDPGYVERQSGNIYRTRIFPISGKSTKTVRLTFCHPLVQQSDHLQYRFLFPETRVKQANLTIRHLQGRQIEILQPSSGPDTRWSYSKEDKVHTLSGSPLGPPATLLLKLPPINDDLRVEAGSFTYQRRASEPQAGRPVPDGTRTLDLIWDCSESGHRRDHAREFAFLDTLFRKHRDLTVKLTKLRLRAEKPQTFTIKDGNWDTLRGTLKQVFYDGGTDLAALRPTKSPTLLFSDGQSYHSRLENPWSHPVTLIDSTGAAVPYWIDQAVHSGGRHLNLADPDGQGIPVTRQFTRRNEPGSDPAAKLPDGSERIIGTLWASEKLRTMETQFAPDQKAIMTHGKKHHLVSHLTSLIVLERFEDHVRYRIPPPEEDLLAKYQQALKNQKAQPTASEVLARQWKKRNDWHSRDFPWQNHVLEPSLARLAIWERALHKTFEAKELNQDSLRQVADTIDRVKRLQEQKTGNEIKSIESYQNWLKELNQSIQQLTRLETLPYGVERAGKMPIAVNGFVNSGGKFLASADTTLQAALHQAGGISKIGSPTRVSVYRGFRKTTYNLLSKEYTPVPLKPGDLIVVEQARHSFDHLDDPFSAGPSPSVDYRNEPAVVIPSRPPNYEPSQDSVDGFAAADPFAAAGGSGDRGPASVFNIARHEQPAGLDFTALKDTLGKAPDPLAVYRQLRPESRYPDAFYLQWGDLLLDLKMPQLAHRVLSNLIETRGPRPTAYRKWAYLLAKHEDWAGALELLERAGRQAPNDLAIVLDQAWILQQQGKEETAKEKRKELVENLDPTDPQAIRIAEIANAEIRPPDGKDGLSLDLRVVVTCASGQSLDLSMAEPSDTMTDFKEWPGGSKIGARTLEAVGVAEYTLRQAVPGPYHLSYRSGFPQLVRLQLYRNWGRDSQTCEEMIVLLPASQNRRTLASFRFDLD